MAMLRCFAKTPHGRAALILCALAGLCGSPALLAAAAPKLTAAQIVDKHVAARGGLPAWRGLQALSVSGKMEAGTGDSIARSVKVSRSRRAPPSKLAAALADTSEAAKGEAGKQ